MSMFDPDNFINAEVNSELDTKSIPAPEGDYAIKIVKLKARAWAKKDDPTINGVAIDVTCEVVDQNILSDIGLEKLIVMGSIPLEIAEDGKSLAEGKGRNVALGRFREACDINRPGMPNSSAIGCIVLGRVGHDVLEDGTIIAKVKRFAKLA